MAHTNNKGKGGPPASCAILRTRPGVTLYLRKSRAGRNMPVVRVLLLAAAILSCLQMPAIADQESITPDQIIARYLQAIGAEQFPSITTFVERGEIQNTITNPNLANLGRLSLPPALQQRERYETYFKSPNLRFSSTISENNQVAGLHGCDGKVAWYIDASLKHQEFTPKPGQEYDCENGFKSLSPLRRDEHTKMRLAGKKKMEGRIAWEIKVENPKSQWPDTYYFDAETYLLLRYKRRDHSVTLSDYREVSGIRRPFTVIREDGFVRATITVREVQVNVPLDDSRFLEPQPINGSISLNPVLPPSRAKPIPRFPPRQRHPTRLRWPHQLNSITQISSHARLRNFRTGSPIFGG